MTDFSQPALSSRLAEQIREALDRSAAATLLRVTVPVPSALAGADPWAIAVGLTANAPEGAERDVRFLWHRDSATGHGATVAGLREAVTLIGDRFQSAAEALAELRSRMVSVGETSDHLPVAVGGFAFAAERPAGSDDVADHASGFTPSGSDSVWSRWPRAAMVVPAVLISRHEKRVTVTVHVALVDGASADSVAETVVRELELIGTVRPAEPETVTPIRGTTIDFDEFDTPGARDAFVADVTEARETIRRGGLRKVVVARAVDLTSHSPGLIELAFSLRRTQPGCTTFLVAGPGGATGETFVGSTPELLVNLRGRDLHTTALAGTRQRNGNGTAGTTTDTGTTVGRSSLLDSAKDTVEQEVVAETIHDALQPLCESFGPTSDRRLARFADVSHIETPLFGRLRAPVGIFRLLEALHPTPAVGGAPREAALAWIANHETFDRGWYAGPVGWVTLAGDGCFVVAIRSALIRDDGVHAFAGCGIVADSDPIAEWEETRWKLRTIASVVLAHLPQYARPTVPVQQPG